jgi:hypothetical protein
MNTKIGKFLFGRDSKVTILLIFSLFVFVGLGCRGGRSSDAKPIPPAYLGDWEGQDGSTLSIRADGKGDYRSGGTKVEGGNAEVDEAAKTVSVTLFGFGKTLKIDQPPTGDQMSLDGIVYRRKGGFTTTTERDTASTSNTPFSSGSNTSSGDVPSKSEMEALVKESMADFADAIEQGDFTAFHANSSRDFQSTFTPEQLKTTFQTYLNNKNIVLPVLNSVDNTSATFTDGPRLRTENGLKIVVANGSFPTKQRTTRFETDYIWRDGEWKLLKFKVNM